MTGQAVYALAVRPDMVMPDAAVVVPAKDLRTVGEVERRNGQAWLKRVREGMSDMAGLIDRV